MDRHHLEDIRRETRSAIEESPESNPRTDRIYDSLKRRALSEPAIDDLERNHRHADTRASALRYFARHVLAVLRDEHLLEQPNLDGRAGNPSHHCRWALIERGRDRVSRARGPRPSTNRQGATAGYGDSSAS